MPVAVSIVVPVFQCSESLPELIERLEQNLLPFGTFEIILVCDNSPDESWAVIQKLSSTHKYVKGLELLRNVGQHRATIAGIAEAVGEVTVVMDCDLQDRPEDVGKLVSQVDVNTHVVVGVADSRGINSGLGRLFRRIYYKLTTMLFESSKVHRVGNMSFFAISRLVRETLGQYSETVMHTSEVIRGITDHVKYVTVIHENRGSNQSSYTLRRRLGLAYESFLLYGSRYLKLLVLFASVLLAATFLFGVTLMTLTATRTIKLPVGWLSVILALSSIFAMQLLLLGLLGAYLQIIMKEVRRRPIFTIKNRT